MGNLPQGTRREKTNPEAEAGNLSFIILMKDNIKAKLTAGNPQGKYKPGGGGGKS